MRVVNRFHENRSARKSPNLSSKAAGSNVPLVKVLARTAFVPALTVCWGDNRFVVQPQALAPRWKALSPIQFSLRQPNKHRYQRSVVVPNIRRMASSSTDSFMHDAGTIWGQPSTRLVHDAAGAWWIWRMAGNSAGAFIASQKMSGSARLMRFTHDKEFDDQTSRALERLTRSSRRLGTTGGKEYNRKVRETIVKAKRSYKLKVPQVHTLINWIQIKF